MFNLVRAFVDASGAPIQGLPVYLTVSKSSTPLPYSFTQTGPLLHSDPILTDSDGEINVWVPEPAVLSLKIVVNSEVLFAEDFDNFAVVESANVKKGVPIQDQPAVVIQSVKVLPPTINGKVGVPFDASVVVIYSNGDSSVNPVDAVITQSSGLTKNSAYAFQGSTAGASAGTLTATFQGVTSDSVTVNLTA